MATRKTSTTAKKTTGEKTAANKTDKKMSQIHAALAVSKKARKPMLCKAMANQSFDFPKRQDALAFRYSFTSIKLDNGPAPSS